MSDNRSCTCHPDEAPKPCQRHFGLSECLMAARIERLEAALRECEGMAVTHHAEDVARTDWSGSGMAQKKARAVATRSGLLMHKIKITARAALEGK